MTDATSTRREHGADPWWGGETTEADLPIAVGDVAGGVAGAPARRASRTRRPPSRRRPEPRPPALVVRLAAMPLRLLVRVVSRSPVLRRFFVRAGVGVVLACLVCGGVGVVLLNNVVIGRTAELGRLDVERGDLRRKNAVMSAKSAQLSAAPRILALAKRRLGMVQPTGTPDFTYLDPASHQLTPLQIVIRERRQAAAAARRSAHPAAAHASRPAPTPTTSTATAAATAATSTTSTTTTGGTPG